MTMLLCGEISKNFGIRARKLYKFANDSLCVQIKSKNSFYSFSKTDKKRIFFEVKLQNSMIWRFFCKKCKKNLKKSSKLRKNLL